MFLGFMLAACEDQKLSDVAIFINPDASTVVEIESGDNALFSIRLQTQHQEVSRVTVSAFDEQYGSRMLLDTAFVDRNVTFDYVFHAPESTKDSLNVRLLFEAWDNKGNHAQNIRHLIVKNRRVLLEEMSGILLRLAPQMGLPDALSFANPTQPFNLATAADSTRADLYIMAADADAFHNISMHSATGTYFVRYGSYDYASASASSLQTVYSSSLKEQQLKDISINDIIIVGHADHVEGVFFINNIIRDHSPAENGVQMAFKSVK